MSSPPVNVNNRAAIERVLEKTLEDTQRDLAAFLRARADAPSFDPRQNRDRNGEQPREPDRGARARLDQAVREQEATDAGRRASRLGSLDRQRPATTRPDNPTPLGLESAPRREPPPLVAPRASRTGTPATSVTPQAFATPGLVRTVPLDDSAGPGLPSVVAGLIGVEARGPAAPLAVEPVRQAPAPEPSMAERIIAERLPSGDWPPIPADMRMTAPMAGAFAPGAGGPRLSAIVPRKVQDRIDEYFRTGFLSNEPFSFEPIEPVPGPQRVGAMTRSGIAPLGSGDAGRPPVEPPRLRLVSDAGLMA